MKTVILSGGQGLRMNEVGRIPKGLVKVGKQPILWHVMSIYAAQGYEDFIIATGHLGNQIEKWVETSKLPWKVQVISTGENTKTGGRVAALASQGVLKDEMFFLTYADGLADIDLGKLRQVQQAAGGLAVLTVVRPRSQFGVVQFSYEGKVVSFIEKPVMDQWINGGFFIFHPDAIKFFHIDSDLERDVLPRLVQMGTLSVYQHSGFWKQMDNPKDAAELNQLWENEKPWATWEQAVKTT